MVEPWGPWPHAPVKKCEGRVIQLSTGPSSQLHFDWTLLEKYLKKLQLSPAHYSSITLPCGFQLSINNSTFGTKHHKQRDTSRKHFSFTVRSNINKKSHTKINELSTTLRQSLDHSKVMVPRSRIRILLLPCLSCSGPHQKWHALEWTHQ